MPGTQENNARRRRIEMEVVVDDAYHAEERTILSD